MNPQIETYKQQILENIQTLEKLCSNYWEVAKDVPEEDLIVYELGNQDIYNAVFGSVFEYFHSENQAE
jgi:hypothetical protein